MQNRWLKRQATAIALSGVVIMGSLTAVIGQEHAATAMSGLMSLGQTITRATPASTPPTTVAAPTMKATKPKGF